jgi:subtilisin family serine protease
VLGARAQGGEPGQSSGLPAGVPKKGSYAFLVKLDTESTAAAQRGARSRGASAARAAARAQLSRVTAAQNRVVAALPAKSRVLYRTHAVLPGLAVVTDVSNYPRLRGISGVTAVYPIAPKSPSNSYAVPLQGAPQAWKAFGDLGQNSTVAVIDTGIDYTHADFGGAGTKAAYDTAKAAKGASPDFPSDKVIGGFDLAGDDYNADPADPNFQPTPSPDPYPLDCNSHGSHVAGTIGGLGENGNGSTYTGAYDDSTPFESMRIGPGVAPRAKLYGFRVFGCEGSTDLVASAIDMAADPNQDGSTSDHADVVNLSLGSDYGSPQDGDSVAVDDASAMGMTMVVASGNAGDLYDVGGSPGDAPSAITAAASQDAASQVDALNVSSPASIAGDYAAERSIAYDWGTKPDLAGDVVRVTQPGNLDGCDPLNATDTGAVAGHIAFVEWTDNDTVRRCGSVKRSGNLAQAGATGFIFADDEETFAAGITGSDTIPGVLVAKSGGDAIRSELVNGNTVTISGTTANGFPQRFPSQDDTLAGFSSRGIGDVDNVKPDVTAVGASVFSAGSGTGNQGLNDSGTSMATPMTAGTAGLVKSMHPDWSPEQVKADIMNTAGQDLFTGGNHTGTKYAPQRVGAGRIQIAKAVQNTVLASVVGNTGAVSASFGPLAVTAPQALSKTIKVQNTGTDAVSYGVGYEPRTSIPGATYSVSPASVTVDPRSSKTVTVTLTLDPSKLTKTIDPTVDRTQGGLPREYQADASGLVVLTGSGVPNLRVPVYAAPRPASVMTQPSSLHMPTSKQQSAMLPLTGKRVHQGSGATAVRSTVAGFELAATSGKAPACSKTVTDNCAQFPDVRAADLRYVGVTSDAEQERSIGADPNTDGMTYFAVSTEKAWRTPAGMQEFDVLIDTDRDGTSDLVLFNSRLTDTDIMVSELVDLATGEVLDAEPINDRFGDTDTALLESDTLVMPVATAALGLTSGASRIDYGVATFSDQNPTVDSIGLNSDGDPQNPLSFDPLQPGLAMYGSFDGDASPLLFRDSPGSVLKVSRNAPAYAADRGKGLLVVHFHNQNGHKAQVVSLSKSAASPTLRLSPNPVRHGRTVTATISVTSKSGVTPTGTVTLRRPDGTVIGTRTLRSGKATLSFTAKKAGTYRHYAHYNGDRNTAPSSSPIVNLKVT